jgi:SsrA-binding protein
MSKTSQPHKTIAVNKKARHLYEFLDHLEAGLALKGSEVKSLRQGNVSFKDAYVRFSGGQAWITGLHIAPYSHAGHDGHDPERERKLLLHSREIASWQGKAEQKGLAVIPVKLYFRRGKVKAEIVLAKGKKTHDRRDEIKQRDIDRETRRQLKDYR